ncbi:MAG: hypothetical protein PHU25_19275 [Deltaproteobacteria bacterium]|nr:hypothetical protein [Deltaproteobacteria bacterium]
MKGLVSSIVSILAAVLFSVCCTGSDARRTPFPTDAAVGDRPAERAMKGKPEMPRLAKERHWQTVGGVGLVRVPVDGFEKLSLPEKTLLYHDSLAVRAGDAVFASETTDGALEISRLLTAVLGAAPSELADIRARLGDYAARFRLSRGLRDPWSGARFVPQVIPGELAALAEAASRQGADLGVHGLDELEALLLRLKPLMFGRSPASSGAAAGDAGQVRRAGRKDVPAGLYARELMEVVTHLRDGLPFTADEARASTGILVDLLETGEPRLSEAYARAWVRTVPRVDLAAGFIGGSADPRGSFAAIAGFRDEARSSRLARLAGQALYFEQRMPFEIALRRLPREVRPPVTGALVAVAAAGAYGAVPLTGLTLPFEQRLRQSAGTKSLLFPNVEAALLAAIGPEVARAFAPDPDALAREERCKGAPIEALSALREVIGRGAGKASATLKETPDSMLTDLAAPLEELRVDLIALYMMFDPKILELGLVPDGECAKAAYDIYVRGALTQLSAVGDAATLTLPGMRAVQVVARVGLERKAVEVAAGEDGGLRARVKDHAAMRAVVADLLARVQRIKSGGDREAAARLFETYGTAVPDDWRRDVQRRWRALGLPRAFSCRFPVLEARRDESGRILDVEIAYPESLVFPLLQFQGVDGVAFHE